MDVQRVEPLTTAGSEGVKNTLASTYTSTLPILSLIFSFC